MKKAILVGASSGIGKELSIILARNGYEVGLMARRIELLEELQREIPTKSHIGYLDLSGVEDATKQIQKMIQKMNGVDLMIINSGTGFLNPDLDWSKEQQTLDINVYGFCALAGIAFKFFSKQKHGHLVGISSIGALRGNPYERGRERGRVKGAVPALGITLVQRYSKKSQKVIPNAGTAPFTAPFNGPFHLSNILFIGCPG